MAEQQLFIVDLMESLPAQLSERLWVDGSENPATNRKGPRDIETISLERIPSVIGAKNN